MVKKIETKEIQKILLEILKEIDKISKRNRITYFLGYGTLLGAVRHKGFIPWDDDLDILLFRKDYDKLLRLCKKELSKDYFLQTFATDRAYIGLFAKVCRNNSAYVEKSKVHRPKHHGISIDIFPLDNIPDSIIYRKMHKYMLLKIEKLREKFYRDDIRIDKLSPNPLRSIYRLNKYLFLITARVLIGPRLFPLIEWLASLFNDQNTINISSLYVGHFGDYGDTSQVWSPNWFEEVEYKQFEDGLFPVPKGWHDYLTTVYGNYMKLPPIKERQPNYDYIYVSLNCSYTPPNV